MPEPTTQPMRSARSQLGARRQPGVLHGLHGSGEAELDEGVHMPRLLGRDVVLDIEPLHLTGETAGERSGIKAGDRRDARAAGDQVGPRLGHCVANRTDQSEPGDDDTPARHGARGQAFWCLLA
jgi:hypothetical protein